jgi:hypothetical protein
MSQRDVLLRWIEEVARVIARLIHGPGAIDLDLAADQIDAALSQHLGPLAQLLPQLEVASGAVLLNDPDRIFGYAQLLALQGAVQQARGDVSAVATQARALAFGREAVARAGEAPSAWRAWLADAEGARSP